MVDPDNLVSPACAPEAYGGRGVGSEPSSNPITGARVDLVRKSMCSGEVVAVGLVVRSGPFKRGGKRDST